MTAKPFVFPIRPRFVDMFRAGTKTFEFRTRRPSVSAGDSALIYECAPVSMVVATATIGHIIDGTPAEVWELTSVVGGISRKDFEEYFSHPCKDCGGSGADPARPPGSRPRDFGCEPCWGSGFGVPRARAVAIEMSMAWLAEPIPLPEGMNPPQSWSRWRGEWPLGETT